MGFLEAHEGYAIHAHHEVSRCETGLGTRSIRVDVGEQEALAGPQDVLHPDPAPFALLPGQGFLPLLPGEHSGGAGAAVGVERIGDARQGGRVQVLPRQGSAGLFLREVDEFLEGLAVRRTRGGQQEAKGSQPGDHGAPGADAAMAQKVPRRGV